MVLDDALREIDLANADDPNLVTVRGRSWALAQVHGVLASEWVRNLVDSPSDALIIAARAHHLRRWESPRSDYPAGRSGYLRWRTDQKKRHCREVAQILDRVGLPDDVTARVQELIMTKGRGSDPESQALEDATCLVFVETQLAQLSSSLDRQHMIDVIRKTAAKMSPAALSAVAGIELTPDAIALLAEALPPSR